MLSGDLALALQNADVPALARTAQSTDWRLETRAEVKGGRVVPTFTVVDPEGSVQGTAEGSDVPASAWASADAAMLKQVAADAGPKVAALLTSIRVARDQADPNSLYNRPAKVMVADVTGAPGDGNPALTRLMRARLGSFGPVIQTTATGADFVVAGQVKIAPIPNRRERVEIQWIVSVPGGDERGRVIQLNEIPAGTLSGFWGDVAVVVVEEASAGLNDVLLRQSGREPGGTQAPAQPTTAPAAEPPRRN